MWIDLYDNFPMEQAQLDKRNNACIRSKYSEDRENMINRMLTGSLAGMYTLSKEEEILIAGYGAWCKEVQAQRVQAREDSILLKKAIKHEKAQRRLSNYILSVGVKERIGVPEIKIEDEVTQEEIIAIAPIEPLSPTIKVTDEKGKVTNIKNPLISKDEAEREKAQKIIDEVDTEVVNLVQLRRNNESKRD